MKQTAKITFCGIITALSVVFMLLSYFPYLTYAVPAVTGLLMMIIVIEINTRWAFAAYAAASVLVFIFAEPESKLMYICLFGYYPILFGISLDDFNTFGRYGVYAFLAAGNAVFVLYDIAVSRMAMFYMNTLHMRIARIFKGK